jgi:hypothetical protein
MSAWRRQAIEMLPEFEARIASSDSPMSLWIDLAMEFDRAFREHDNALLRRVLRFAGWCVSEHSGSLPNDTSTAAACAFYEHLPANRAYWPHFRQWFFPHEFSRLLPIFKYHLSAEDVAQLEKVYAVAEA